MDRLKSAALKLYRPPVVGLLAFVTVITVVPLAHSLAAAVSDVAGPGGEFYAFMVLGFAGAALLLHAIKLNNEAYGTLAGFIAAYLIWDGWAAYGFRFNAYDQNVPALVVDGEYVFPGFLLFVQSSIGILFATLPFFVFNKDTRCSAFIWIQRRLHLNLGEPAPAAGRNIARITFLETLYVIWFCYVVSLFIVDDRYLGPHHPATYVIGFGLILWSVYLVIRLTKFTRIMAAIRYAIPTKGLAWIAIELGSQWGLYEEVWLAPFDYALEMGIVLGACVLAFFIAVFGPQRRQV